MANYDKDLFARLRFLRKQLADKENIPPYIVFNDATLQELAQYMPTSNIEMLQINGVGAIKLERFGQPFMALIREHKAIFRKGRKRISAVKKQRIFRPHFFSSLHLHLVHRVIGGQRLVHNHRYLNHTKWYHVMLLHLYGIFHFAFLHQITRYPNQIGVFKVSSDIAVTLSK